MNWIESLLSVGLITLFLYIFYRSCLVYARVMDYFNKWVDKWWERRKNE